MSKQCPIEATLSRINGKWKLLIIKALSKGPVRYGALEKAIPNISAKVLTQQLREMEGDGLVIRTVYAEIPPKVEYSLDEMGLSIFSVFFAMRQWSLEKDTKHAEEIECRGCDDCRPSDYYKRV
jgi:DNA-binding HxlR family transcriptional regulator